MVGIWGSGTEKKVARFWVSVTIAIARASHLLHWAVVLLTSMSYQLDRVSGFMSLVVGMVYLKCCCCGG